MSQTSTIFRPSRVQNLVLYWHQYKAQLMLQSPTEANTCDGHTCTQLMSPQCTTVCQWTKWSQQVAQLYFVVFGVVCCKLFLGCGALLN